MRRSSFLLDPPFAQLPNGEGRIVGTQSLIRPINPTFANSVQKAEWKSSLLDTAGVLLLMCDKYSLPTPVRVRCSERELLLKISACHNIDCDTPCVGSMTTSPNLTMT